MTENLHRSVGFTEAERDFFTHDGYGCPEKWRAEFCRHHCPHREDCALEIKNRAVLRKGVGLRGLREDADVRVFHVFVVGILKGSFMFLADLMRSLHRQGHLPLTLPCTKKNKGPGVRDLCSIPIRGCG